MRYFPQGVYRSNTGRWMTMLLAGILSGSCKDDPFLQSDPDPARPGTTVLVLNEGNYQWGNASLSMIDTETGTVAEDVFQQANQRPVGDVLQSVAVVNGSGWLVVNNSQKIERIDLTTFKAGAPIGGLQSPRYVLPVNNNKVYVTDLYADGIHILDAVSGSIRGKIACPGWTEELVVSGSEVWICNVRKRKVYVVDTGSDRIIDSVAVGDAPRNIRRDKNGRLWVLCEGEIPPGESAGSLWLIDPGTRSVLRSFPFTGSPMKHPGRLQLNDNADRLYYIENGVYRMSITDTVLPAAPLIQQGNGLFYGLGIHPADESIWISDARDYVQKGTVYRYASAGVLLSSWPTGFIPASFYFY